MNIYHKHHIVPRHMGGSDDPSNLIQLTIEEHANAHEDLYKTYGKQEDYIAWKALSGQIKYSEANYEAARLGGLNGLEHLKGKTYKEAYGEKAGQRVRVVIDSNIRRKGIKYKSMNRSITSNDIKVCCLECQHQTSVAQLTRHLRKHS